MKNSQSSAGGYVVLFALVALLAAPLVIGYFTLGTGTPAKAQVHAAADLRAL